MTSKDDMDVSKTTGEENTTTTTSTTNETNNGGTPTTTSITLQLTITALPGAPRVPLVLSSSSSNDQNMININSTELRHKVSTTTKIPLSNLRLIYRGRLITDNSNNNDSNAITEYKLEDGSVLHCMGKPSEDNHVTTTTTSNNSTNPTTVPASTPVTAATSATGSTSSAINNTSTSSTSPPATNATNAPSSSTSSVPSLQTALDRMRTSNASVVYTKALKTIQKILSNIIDHPLEEKYRTIKVSNPAFQQKLLNVIHHDIVLRTCGFTVINNESTNHQMVYTMIASSEQWPTLLQSKSMIDTAIQRTNTNTTTPLLPNLLPSTIPPIRNSSNNNTMMNPLIPTDPNVIQQQLRHILSNPQQFTAMMQNPMIQEMFRNDPRLANNIPMFEQALNDIRDHPEIIDSMNQMLSDPNMQQLMSSPEYIQTMQQRLQQQSLNTGNNNLPPLIPPNLFPTSSASTALGNNNNTILPWGTPPPSTAAQSNSTTTTTRTGNGNTNNRTDDELTEEEMIAEAIRRSLQDSNNNNNNN